MKSALESVLHAGVVTHAERSQVASLLAASEDSELTITTKTGNDDATADLFKMLTEKTEKTLSDMRKKELDAGHEFASSKLTLENEIKSMEEETKAQQELKATTLQAQAQANKDLAVEKKVLQEDVSYSSDTKRDCLSKAEDFETLHIDAVNELGALAKAKEILMKGVTAALVETKFKLRSKKAAAAGDGKARALRAIQALGR